MKKLIVTALCASLTGLTLAAAPALALDNPLVVDLHHGTASQQEASATIFGSNGGVLVNVTANGKLPTGAAISLNTGTCPNPGGVAFALAGLNGGASLTQLKHSLADVANRAKSMVIHENAQLNSAPYACGNISE